MRKPRKILKTDGAPPGIEPGPPAPKAGILPLNYGACCIIILTITFIQKLTKINGC